MRSLVLLAVVIAVLVVTSATTPVVAGALGPGFAPARVYDRVFEVLLAVAVVLVWRRLDLGDPKALGLATTGAGRTLGRGIAVGIAGLAVGLALCWAGGALSPALRYPVFKTVGKVVLGLGAAVAIGLGEEALFRGVLLRRATLDFGRPAALVVINAIYAVVHAIRTGGGDDFLTPMAGWERTARLFAPLGDLATWPSVLGLLGLGLLLSWCRLRTGSLWLGVGIHAGWVAVFRVGRLFFDLGHTPPWLVGPGWPPLIGGAAGWTALAITTVLAASSSRARSPRGRTSA